MSLSDWFKQLFAKDRRPLSVPSYRFGDFTEEELRVIWAAVELLTRRQMETADLFGHVPVNLEDQYRITAQLYREVLAATDQASRDAQWPGSS